MGALAVLFLHGVPIFLWTDMGTDLVCWRCGESIENLPMPLTRLAECGSCHAELHVCKLCEFYDKHIADQCREPVVDYVKEKQRANFCDYFRPRANAYNPASNGQEKVMNNELNALFGIETKRDKDRGLNEEDRTRSELDRLFGVDGDMED